MEASGELHAPVSLPPEKKPLGTHWIGGWLGPRAGLDPVEKRKISFLCRESNLNSSAVQGQIGTECRGVIYSAAQALKVSAFGVVTYRVMEDYILWV
jgi:hypothetical protein